MDTLYGDAVYLMMTKKNDKTEGLVIELRNTSGTSQNFGNIKGRL